jgi:CDP-diacylglycerol--glycerol-3-phosphate 3-phosphatidyltransferase
MSVSLEKRDRPVGPDTAQFFNVPNQLTTLRLVLSIVLFFFIAYEYYLTSTILFMIAAGTDWIDGYWARKYGQVTPLGRILDPFVDKIIICGTFIFLAAVPGSQILPWMAVVVMGREILVTALRSFFEQQGTDFSASMSGKLKMVCQCAAAAMSLYRLSFGSGPVPPLVSTLLPITVWAAVLMTIYSGVGYVYTAYKLLRH